MNTISHSKIKPNPLPRFARANFHKGRERIRWTVDRHSVVTTFSREVAQ